LLGNGPCPKFSRPDPEDTELMPTINRLFLLFILAVPTGWPCTQCLAEEKSRELPLYEYGIGGLASYLPHYYGSDEYEFYGFPIPYFVYRGENLKADREGVRGIFWRNTHWQTDISLSGNPPVPDDNEAREGMGELDALVEVGPALRFYFYEGGSRDSFFTQLAFRGAFSVGWDGGPTSSYEGNITELSLSYHDSCTFAEQNAWFHLDGTVRFGDSDMHSYFYDVAPRYVTQSRERYSAGAGYGGFQLSASMFKDLSERIQAGVFLRWSNVEGAVFDGSPLVRDVNNLSSVVMLFWKFGHSEQMVR